MKPHQEDRDPIFSVDALMGRILDALAGIGVFCAVIAVCFFAGYLT
jgi:hypothetical protein